MGSFIYDGTAPKPAGCAAANDTLAAVASVGLSHDSLAGLAAGRRLLDTPAEDRFTSGTKRGALGQTLSAAVQLLFSAITPKLVDLIGLKATYVASFVVMVLAFAGLGALPRKADASWSPNVGVALMALGGIPYAATNIFPFSLIGRLFGRDPNLALYMGALNCFIALPQLLDTTYSGAVADEFGYNYVFVIAAGWAVLAVLAVLWLDVAKREPGRELLSDAEREEAVSS